MFFMRKKTLDEMVDKKVNKIKEVLLRTLLEDCQASLNDIVKKEFDECFGQDEDGNITIETYQRGNYPRGWSQAKQGRRSTLKSHVQDVINGDLSKKVEERMKRIDAQMRSDMHDFNKVISSEAFLKQMVERINASQLRKD